MIATHYRPTGIIILNVHKLYTMCVCVCVQSTFYIGTNLIVDIVSQLP